MKNLQSLLTEKGINVITNEQLFMVRGGKRGRKKASVKSMGSKCSSKGGVIVTPPIVLVP